MTAQEVKLSNFYESTLNGILASGATSGALAAAPTSDGTSVIAAPYYLVIDPDNSANREVVLVTSSSGTTISAMTRDLEGRHTTDPDHQAGTTVRMAVLAEQFADINDRADAIKVTADGAIQTSLLQDDDTFASPAANKVASSESIKAYTDAQIAALPTGVSLGLVLALS